MTKYIRWQWITNTNSWLSRYNNKLSLISVISKYIFTIDYEEEGSYYCFVICLLGLYYVQTDK
jgi:hypothetical protein